MKAAEWKRRVRPLTPVGEHWEFRGPLCYRLPVGWVLAGVLGEGSGFDQGVFIWRVQMPLFVPSDVVDLSWSERIGGGANKYDRHDIDSLAIAIKAATNRVDREDHALARMAALGGESTNRRLSETAGYASLLQGDLPTAKRALVRAASGTTTAVWEQEIVDRAQLILTTIDHGGRESAVTLLQGWRDATASALGLRAGA